MSRKIRISITETIGISKYSIDGEISMIEVKQIEKYANIDDVNVLFQELNEELTKQIKINFPNYEEDSCS